MNLDYPACDLACARELEKAITGRGPSEVAAFITEPVEGNGGIIVPPPDYFSVIRDITKKYDVLFICDEVQTGFGRTGRTFAIENWGQTPDILTVAKALANGLPVGAFIATSEIAAAYTRPGASTLGGNPVTAETALATLDFHSKNNLTAAAHELGKYFKQGLLQLQEKHAIIGDVRGLGLMLGAELVKDGKEPAGEETERVLEDLKARGIFIGKTGAGRNVLTFQPPLIITKDNIDQVVDALDDVLEKLPN
jgi:4-aminobutyrate aminotransferase/4-aminobutyrate aminotransferase/(S)-3-amino-2-methylpropionate transaminase